MSDKDPKLTDGGEWIDHEDCIIGDQEGLENLIQACNTALEKGEFYGPGLGDWVGVKRLDSDWFKDPQDSPQTRFANFVLAAILIFLLALILVGLITVLSWVFG